MTSALDVAGGPSGSSWTFPYVRSKTHNTIRCLS